MNKMIRKSCLVTAMIGTVIAVSLLNTGCGNKDSIAQGGGYVAGSEATRKGGGGISDAPAMPKGKSAPGAKSDAKPGADKAEQKSTVVPPSNTMQTQGGTNLAL
ncbi:MAG: hypothetical protein H8F28_08960 [Fibrella sp.]|nr:hypothetical protein [Armatimonadota bacterium]